MSEVKPTVLLFTDSYPFDGGERSFLPEEVAVLSRFVTLVIIPSSNPQGNTADVPAGVTVEIGLAAWNDRRATWVRA